MRGRVRMHQLCDSFHESSSIFVLTKLNLNLRTFYLGKSNPSSLFLFVGSVSLLRPSTQFHSHFQISGKGLFLDNPLYLPIAIALYPTTLVSRIGNSTFIHTFIHASQENLSFNFVSKLDVAHNKIK